ncbi:hypothetical protein HY991_05635 [Candidatus Micrarchaeota archaeon]|nr:hypothetical protein [Candidatus Micrarchaeota archaeon]
MPVEKLSYMGMKDLKELKKAGVIKEPTERKFTPTPMFLPTDTGGLNIANVMTRESFIHRNIGIWLEWRFARVFAVIFGVIAIFLLTYNFVLAAVAGAVAGWLYGRYVWRNFYIVNLLGRRKLLEST